MTRSGFVDREVQPQAAAIYLPAANIARYPLRLSREAFYPLAYRIMYLARRIDDTLLELFAKGYAKGTVTTGAGNEATAVGMTMPLRPGQDCVSLLHRDLAGHLLFGMSPYRLFSQFLANAESPTHGREGNVHHGDAGRRRLPMMSHLGRMLSPVVGATWSARRNGEDVFGLAVLGDGGSSTGESHEAMNLAAVRRVPVLFLIQNNGYSFSTPTRLQFHCRQLSDRAAGYGISGQTIDGTDAWTVYTAVCDALDAMADEQLPRILECKTLRLGGHAAYDKGEYIGREELEDWRRRDPLPRARRELAEYSAFSPAEIAALEAEADEEVRAAAAESLAVARPDPAAHSWNVFAPATPPMLPPFQAKKVKNGDAVRRALDYILAANPTAVLLGLDIGPYGSAFKTCKGLIDRFGPERVIDMPLAEGGMVGFALGASQTGTLPIIEFQFADFSTEATTQIGLNAGTWYFRAGREAPLLLRLPCGGGITLGPFHSGEFEGLWSRFPGLKLLYPATAQETFEAIFAGFYDPNPCLVFEHKQLYWSRSDDIDFDGNLQNVWRPRCYGAGTELTLIGIGAMVHEALAAVRQSGRSVEVWNPLVLAPLEIGPMLESVNKTGRLLVVQECGQTQGLGDRLISSIVRQAGAALKCPPRLIAAPDVPVPFAPELEGAYRPGAKRIAAAIEEMLGER